MSMQSELLSRLQSGDVLTTKQISGWIGLKNPHRAIHLLRSQGHCVYGNPAVLKDGTTKYRIGKPSRSMVSVAAQFGSTLFTRS
jgi:hypothetical protein